MCEAAGPDRPVIMLNENLVDIPSAGSVMGVQGREERMAWVSDWETIYHFRLLYRKPFFHPVYGALRKTWGKQWDVYKRVVKKEDGSKREKYVLANSYTEEPGPKKLTMDIAKTLSF